MLTQMIFMFPALAFASEDRAVVVNGSHLEFYLLKLMFMGCIVKGIVLFENVDEMDEDNLDEEMDVDDREIKSFQLISQFYSKYNLKYRSLECKKPITEKTVRKMFEFVKNSCMQFLRCSCLLFHFLTDVDFPEEMQVLEGEGINRGNLHVHLVHDNVEIGPLWIY
uniref:E3 ubiquitin-protein ligase UBR-like C-terminal domain-containing protein n=1 Tax=Megaselia scalaris TaxID=36166 RepID=T1GET5_MEGSC